MLLKLIKLCELMGALQSVEAAPLRWGLVVLFDRWLITAAAITTAHRLLGHE